MKWAVSYLHGYRLGNGTCFFRPDQFGRVRSISCMGLHAADIFGKVQRAAAKAVALQKSRGVCSQGRFGHRGSTLRKLLCDQIAEILNAEALQ